MLQRLIPSAPCRPGEENKSCDDLYAECVDILYINRQPRQQRRTAARTSQEQHVP